MEKKLRIQLFDEEGRLDDDRTVVQDPELAKGPTEEHVGIFRIEFTLEGKDDIEKVKTYLDQMVGNLPLGSKKARKTKIKTFDDPEDRAEFLNLALENTEDQDMLINFLRENGFVFLMTDFLETFKYPITLKEKHANEYQWMVRQLREAKNPKSDKYDPMLMFGIQLIPEHNEKIVVYLDGGFHKAYKVPIPEKPKEVFKKTTMMKFPPYMTETEREKFRYELRLYQNDTGRKISKFFDRWSEWVENIPEIPERTEG